MFSFATKAERIPEKCIEFNARKTNNHYLPPPMAKESKSPLIKNEFSPVHRKHCGEKAKTITTLLNLMTYSAPLIRANLKECFFHDFLTMWHDKRQMPDVSVMFCRHFTDWLSWRYYSHCAGDERRRAAPWSEGAAWRGTFLRCRRTSHWASEGGRGRPRISDNGKSQERRQR